MRGPFLKIDDVTVKAATNAAVLVRIDEKDIWFPDSQIHADSEIHCGCRLGEKGDLIITQWIAEQKHVEDHGEEYEP